MESKSTPQRTTARERVLQIVPFAALALFALFLLRLAVLFLLPLDYSIKEPIHLVTSSPSLSEQQPKGQVSDAAKINQLVELLNESSYHRPTELLRDTDSPGIPYSIILLHGQEDTVCQIFLAGTSRESARIRITDCLGEQELIPYNRKEIVSALFDLFGW